MAALSDDKTLAQRNAADTLAELMGASARSVTRSWGNLEALGEIACVRNRNGGRAYGKRRYDDGSLHGQAPTWEVVVPLGYIELRQAEQHAKGKTIYDHVGVNATRPAWALAKQTGSKTDAIASLPEIKGDSLSPLNPIKADSLSPLNPTKGDSLSPDLSSEKGLFKSFSYSGAGAPRDDEEGIEVVGQSVPEAEPSEPTAASETTGSGFEPGEAAEPHTQQPELHGAIAEAKASTVPLPATEPTPTTDRPNDGAEAEAPAAQSWRSKHQPERTLAEEIASAEANIAFLREIDPHSRAIGIYEDRLDILLAQQTPSATEGTEGRILILQNSQTRSATASVDVAGSLGVKQDDQGVRGIAIGVLIGGHWTQPRLIEIEQHRSA